MVIANKPFSVVRPEFFYRNTFVVWEENRLLRGAVAAMQLRKCKEDQRERGQALQLSTLREANQNLVLAASRESERRVAAEQAYERQTMFLALVAHELRNPVASIAFANSLMRDLNSTTARLEKLKGIVERQADRLIRLADDLLDVSLIPAGKLTLQLQSALLSEIINSAIVTAQQMIEQRNQRIDTTLPNEDIKLRADPIRLAQLIGNLLGNSSKFSPPGTTVHISALVQGSSVSITVRDQGKGISAQDAERIFDMFEQGPGDVERVTSGGLGIGLTLVRAIATLHGGSVSVSSPGVGLGSEFTVLLPLQLLEQNHTDFIKNTAL